MIIKMTTDYFGISYYSGDGKNFTTDKLKAKKYDDLERVEKHCMNAQKFWDRYKVEVIKVK